MSRLKTNHSDTKCCVCGSCSTYIGPDGNPDWYKYKGEDNKRAWDGKTYLCNKCYRDIMNNLPDSYKNVIKSMRKSRTEGLDRSSENGKAVITQWIVAKTLGLRDLNVDNNNFRQSVDLSEHSIYHNIDVKSGTLLRGYWHINIHHKNETFRRVFDTIIILCMDVLWKSVERVYIIPYQEICDELFVDIYENWSKVLKRKGIGSKFEHIEKFRTDEKFYGNIYDSVDIPTFFSPFDLWNSKYNKKVNRRE